MWSHYADCYRGFCLEFNTECDPFDKLQPVEYVSEFPRISTLDIGLNKQHGDVVKKLFCTKSDDWSYEEEWRVIHAKQRQTYGYGNALTGVYFGPRMTDQNIDLICLILYSQMPEVKLYRGSKSSAEFRVTFEELGPYLPYAEAKRRDLV